jgi:hypothetical protein
MTSFNPDGSVHQMDARLGEYVDPAELRSTAQAVPALGVYHAGLLTWSRPNVGSTGWPAFKPRSVLHVLKLILRNGPEAWAAAGAASVAIGSATTRSWFTADLLAGPPLDMGWGDLTIGGDSGPLIVTLFGGPTSGSAEIFLIATSGLVYPAGFDLATEGYLG